MRNQRLRTTVLQTAALALPLLLASVGATPHRLEEKLAKGDQEKLAKSVAAFFEAKDADRGVNSAIEELAAEIAKVEKRNKKLPPVLTMVEDLTRVFELASPPDARPTPGKILEESFPGWGDRPVEYAVRAPKSYNKTKGPYPVLLLIPDAGETPKQHLDEWWADGALRDAVILVAVGMPENTAIWSENGTPEEPGGRAILLQVLRKVSEDFATDKGRISLGGRGPGVAAAGNIATASPHTFCGFVGRAGDLEPIPAENFRNLPTLFAGGGPNVTAFVEAAGKAGLDNCTNSPAATEADFGAWVLARDRVDYPQHITFSPTASYSRSAYWLEVEGFELGGVARVEATIERDTNTIRVKAAGVSTVWIDFNDAMVDMDKPVIVELNGLQHQDLFPRNLKMLLTQAYNSSDPRRIVTNRKKYDLPTGAE